MQGEEMGSVAEDESWSPPHAIIFPFMSKGHTMPLLYFARLLLRRQVAVTVATTPANRPFIAHSLRHSSASIIDIPFPENLPDVPTGVESTDKLPSMSLFYPFAVATEHMQPHFERLLCSLPRVSFMVSDGFLWWTLDSASKFGIPRFLFYGMNNYSLAVSIEAVVSGVLGGPQSPDELVSLTRFPWIRLTKNDFDPVFVNPDPQSLAFEFHTKVRSSAINSHGTIVNSFYELEPVFIDYLNTESSPKSWCVGPLCVEKTCDEESNGKPSWIEWLDQKQNEACSVLYVAFGSQAEVSAEQLMEIASGLEESKVNFLWVTRKKEWKVGDGYEERVKGRGMIVREWVDQTEILMHQSVKGFVSHCGWNSVLESVCAGVPILAWPLMAEQPLNARMVEEEIKVGLRVETCDGSVKGFVKREGLKRRVRELMEGEKGKEARKNVKEMAHKAKKALEPGGSSWRTLETLIEETCRKKESSGQ